MNLIICASPLQVLIAEKIVALHPEEEFYGIMITYSDNLKYRLYYKRLSDICIGSKYITGKDPSFTGDYSSLLLTKLRIMSARLRIGTVYVCNIDQLVVHLILGNIRFKTIETFDDGLANVITTSHFYIDTVVDKKMKNIRRLIGANYSTQSLRNMSTKHYTLYPGVPNVYPNPIPIDLFPLKQPLVTKRAHRNKVSIFLGQPIYDATKSKTITEHVMQKIKVDMYLPHPRESYTVDNVTYIDTPLTIEDYLIQQYSKNPDTLFEVYTFYSSAALNIRNMPNVHVVTLWLAGYNQPGIDEIYALFRKFNVKIQRIQ